MILSSLFLSKTCEHFRIGFKVSSCSDRSTFTIIIIIAYQCDGALVPVPVVPGCGVGDVDLPEVVQVSAIFFCPSVGLPRISILFILLPSDYNGALIVFPCSSSSIHCFPMIYVPLSFAVFLTSRAQILEFESSRGCLYPVHAGVRSPKPSCTSATVAFQKKLYGRMSHSHKFLYIGFLPPMSQNSECILAVCFQMRAHRSLEFQPKDLLLAVSLLSVFDHFLSP